MLAFKLILVAATGVLGVAIPEPTAAAQLDLRAVNCAKGNDVLNAVKKLGPAGNAFCRAYLGMPGTKTMMATITPASTV
jgi:hypothetical protein